MAVEPSVVLDTVLLLNLLTMLLMVLLFRRRPQRYIPQQVVGVVLSELVTSRASGNSDHCP